MFRLVCISGTISGRSFLLKEGDNIIGRSEEADINVPSQGVSKKHCSIVVRTGTATLVDLGSRNGTFVNGVLVKKKDIAVGDKIGVYDHIFQLLPGIEAGVSHNMGIPGIDFNSDSMEPEYKGMPRKKLPGFIGSIDEFFETTVMPPFENLMKTYHVSWIISISSIIITALVALIVAIPIVEFDQVMLSNEAANRGVYIASFLAEKNRSLIGMNANENPSVDAARDMPGVYQALVTDVDGQVLAPEEEAGKYLSDEMMARVKLVKNNIAQRGVKSKKNSEDEENEDYKKDPNVDSYNIGGGRYIVTAPIIGYSQEESKNILLGFSQVIFTTKAIEHSLAAAWQRIFIGMAIAGFIGLLLAIFFSRLFSLPFIRMYDDIDLALKGEMKKLNFTLGSKYGKDLVELINILIRKARKASAKVLAESDVLSLGGSGGITDEVVIFDSMCKAIKTPFAVIDLSNSVVTANPAFSQIANPKNGEWQGVSLVESVKDQKVLGVILNLVSKSTSMGQDVTDEVVSKEKAYRVSVSSVRDEKGANRYNCVGIEVV